MLTSESQAMLTCYLCSNKMVIQLCAAAICIEQCSLLCQIDLKAVVRPRTELHRASLVVEREIRYVNLARGSQLGGRRPKHSPICVHHGLGLHVARREIICAEEHNFKTFKCTLRFSVSWKKYVLRLVSGLRNMFPLCDKRQRNFDGSCRRKNEYNIWQDWLRR